MTKYHCQKTDTDGKTCGLECTFDRFNAEYVVLKTEMLTRKTDVKRTMWVICPIHGRVPYAHYGHHVSRWEEFKSRWKDIQNSINR